MPKHKFNSRQLLLAENLLEEIADAEEDEEISEADRNDLATSLLRQWITYDGNATLFIGEEQIYFVLAQTKAGDYRVIPDRSPPGWMNRLIQDWKIAPEELPPLIRQLNLGQSVESVNSEGLPIRLWANPKERSQGVEPLIKEPIPSGHKRDYRKIAGAQLEIIFGSQLDPRAMDELMSSLASQWQQHDGHACLFFKENRQISLVLTEQADGGCNVAVSQVRCRLEPLLASLGVPTEIIPGVIARINLGQEVEFRDRRGVRPVLWFDPKARQVRIRVLPVRRPLMPSDIRPICCPKCGAVLMPQLANESPQPCPMCGHVVALR